MLNYLIVKNFQRLKRIKVKFDPYVTTIIGENDLGKTSLLRALRWVCLNKPIGKGFLRTGSKQVTVTLGVDKHEVVRSSGTDKSNYYSLDGEKLKSFRYDVPEPVRQLLYIQEINLHKQLPAFWLSLTPGQVTKELNKLVDLESIDRFQTELSKRQKRVRDRLLIVDHAIEIEQRQISALRWVRGLNVKMGGLLTAIGGLRSTAHHAARVALLAAGGSNQAQRAERLTTARTAAHTTARGGRRLWGAGNRMTGLGVAIRSLGTARGTLSGLDVTPPQPPAYRGERLEELVAQLEDFDNEIADVNQELETNKADLEEKLGGRCPECGSFLSDQTLI